MLKLIADMPTSEDTGLTLAAKWMPFWPIAVFAITGLLSLGAIFTKLEFIAQRIEKYEHEFVVVNDRQTLTGQTIIEMRGVNIQQTSDIQRNATDIIKLQNQVDGLREAKRWSPGVK